MYTVYLTVWPGAAVLSAFRPTALDTWPAFPAAGKPSTFQARFCAAVCASDPAQSATVLVDPSGLVAVTGEHGSDAWGDGGWSKGSSPNVVALVKFTVTQSPMCARITSGWMASLPCRPLDTVPAESAARTAEMFWFSTYIIAFGSLTPNLFRIIVMLIAETLNVSCGAEAHGLVLVLVLAVIPAEAEDANATPLAGPKAPSTASADAT